jgi:hypothetical protein
VVHEAEQVASCRQRGLGADGFFRDAADISAVDAEIGELAVRERLQLIDCAVVTLPVGDAGFENFEHSMISFHVISFVFFCLVSFYDPDIGALQQKKKCKFCISAITC